MGCGQSNESQKLIVITGATGLQGNHIIQSLLKQKKRNIQIRAITRNPQSQKAQQLERQGVQIAQADFDDVESLTRAFEGAYGVFCVTNFWEHMSAEKEKQQAKNLAQACQNSNVQHAIWSTLEQTKDLMKTSCNPIENDYIVPHFDGKNEANQYFIDCKVPTTFLYTSFQYDNFINFGMGPKKQNDTYFISFNLGSSKMAMMSLEDLGNMGAYIFSQPNLIGQDVYVASEIMDGYQIAQIFSDQLNIDCQYQCLTTQEYQSLQFPGAHELGNMFQFWDEHQEKNISNRNIEKVKSMINKTVPLSIWIEQNKENLLIQKEPKEQPKKNILLVAASASSTSINLQLIKYTSQFLQNHQCTCISLQDFIIDDIYVQGKESNSVPEQVNKFRELLNNHDGYIISLAENNFQPTAVWKNLLDWLSRTNPGNDPMNDWKKTFQNKPMFLLGTTPAPMTPSQTIQNAHDCYPYLGAKVSGMFHLPDFYNYFKDGCLNSKDYDNKLNEEIQKFLKILL